MKIEIVFCTQWNYKPKAVVTAEEIEKNFDIKVNLIGGSGGIFDVKLEDKIIYSKHDRRRFPQEGEMTEILKRILN